MLQATHLETIEHRVVKQCDSKDVVQELTDLFDEAELLLTYGPTNDEQALARDIHKAAESDSAAQQKVQRMPLYNLYEACKRLKLAHDRKIPVADAAKLDKRCTLDAMHTHFVTSSGRRFVSPLPEGKSLSD